MLEPIFDLQSEAMNRVSTESQTTMVLELPDLLLVGEQERVWTMAIPVRGGGIATEFLS